MVIKAYVLRQCSRADAPGVLLPLLTDQPSILARVHNDGPVQSHHHASRVVSSPGLPISSPRVVCILALCIHSGRTPPEDGYEGECALMGAQFRRSMYLLSLERFPDLQERTAAVGAGSQYAQPTHAAANDMLPEVLAHYLPVDSARTMMEMRKRPDYYVHRPVTGAVGGLFHGTKI